MAFFNGKVPGMNDIARKRIEKTVAALALTTWLIVKGVDVAKWKAKAALAESR